MASLAKMTFIFFFKLRWYFQRINSYFGGDLLLRCSVSVSQTFLFSLLGIDEQGLYRIAGVNSKVQKLLNLAMGKQRNTQMHLIKPEHLLKCTFAVLSLSNRSKDVRWCWAGQPRVGDQDNNKCYQALPQVWHWTYTATELIFSLILLQIHYNSLQGLILLLFQRLEPLLAVLFAPTNAHL